MKNSFNELTVDELDQKKTELTTKLKNIRFDKVMGHVDNPMEARTVKRGIARINTILNEHKLGIRKA